MTVSPVATGDYGKQMVIILSGEVRSRRGAPLLAYSCIRVLNRDCSCKPGAHERPSPPCRPTTFRTAA